MTDKFKRWIDGRFANIDEGDDLQANAPRAYMAVAAAVNAMRDHYEDEVKRAEKSGRTSSECVCDACKAMAGIESALFGDCVIVDEAHQMMASPEAKKWANDLARMSRG